MNLIADENLDRSIVEFLRDSGNDVIWMVEFGPGTGDIEIIKAAQREGRIILTFDRDFGELVFHQGFSAPGILPLRFGELGPAELLRKFQEMWKKIEPLLPGHFVVVSNDKMRRRPIPSKEN